MLESALLLVVHNEGKRALRYAAVQAKDDQGKRSFPQADLEVNADFPAGETLSIRVGVDELKAMGCRSLAVMDTSGHAWPVADIPSAILE